MSKVRVCFLGTPAFAVTALQGLLADEHYEIVGVVTQPDRPAGRKLQLTPSPVKTLALSHNLKVLAVESLKSDAAAVEEIRSWGAELGVVVAFGQILTEEFMAMFRFGCVNLHGSLLPRWRGAAPIQRALEAGDKESGVTLQKMVKKLDAGDILGVRRVALTPQMNALELHDRLAELGVELLHVELMDYIRGNLAPLPQDESQVTVAKKIDKAEAEINWSESAEQIDGKIRGFVYGPGTFTWFRGKKLKIHKAQPLPAETSSTPGEIIAVSENDFQVATGKGRLKILEVQPESRTRMSAQDFMQGHAVKVKERLGV